MRRVRVLCVALAVLVFVCAVGLVAGCAASVSLFGVGVNLGGAAGAAPAAGGEPGLSPEEPRRASEFLFFSDTQADPDANDYSGVGELIAQALSRNDSAGLVFFGGDVVNGDGADGEWEEVRRFVVEQLGGVATAAVAGNHDSYDMLADFFDYPAVAPVARGAGSFCSLEAGPVFFIMMDSNIMGAANPNDVEWLRGELQGEGARRASWRVVVMHHPMWPVADVPKDMLRAETMREHFLPLFEEYGVALILCGHQHVYSRSLPMRGEAPSGDGHGIVQVMAATGDKLPYVLGERDFIAAAGLAPNYLLLSADEDRLTVIAYDGVHAILDSFTMHNA